jgi:exo-beta-1,3-glucanase (GH17 family)
MTTYRSASVAYLSAIGVALWLLGCLWQTIGKPHELPDVASPAHRLQCASYTPFDKDQSPFDQPLHIRPERMDADLALLAKRFQCLRTYSVTGLEALPGLARKHGLKLIMGAWVSRSPRDTAIEIQGLIHLARENPDVVEAAIVGNEALLRKEVSAKQLVALIEQVKRAIAQPVTYADVWEFWLKHPEIAPAVDFITLHLLPYWEDKPAGIDDALREVQAVHRRFEQEFAPKPIMIGETGWPSEGRQRETAVPSRVNQAIFIRGVVAMAEKNGWRYNLIEAFDQPWKRISEGTVGGFWGLYDADRQDKSILAGSVSNQPHWKIWLTISIALFSLSLLLAGRPATLRSAILLPLLAALAAACIGRWAELAWITSRYPGEWLWAGALLLLNLVVASHASLSLSARQGWRAPLFAWLQARSDWWLLASGFAGAVMMLALVADARYRSFPSAALLLPALVYLCRPVTAPKREITLLALLIASGTVPQLYEETLSNLQAIGWAITSVLLAAALWRSLRLASGPSSRGTHQTQ